MFSLRCDLEKQQQTNLCSSRSISLPLTHNLYKKTFFSVRDSYLLIFMTFHHCYDLLLWTNILRSLLYIKTASAICYHAGRYFPIDCMDSFLNPKQLLQASRYCLPQYSPAVKPFNTVKKNKIMFCSGSLLLKVIGTLLHFQKV